MGIEDEVRRKFRKSEEDAKKQHEQKVKIFLENYAKAKRVAEKAKLVETLKGLERAISREKVVQATQVWWTDKAVTYKQNSFSAHGIGHLEVTPHDSRVIIPKAFGEYEGQNSVYGDLFFRAGLRWLRDKPNDEWLRDKPSEELQSQSILSMIGAFVDKHDNIIVWPANYNSAYYGHLIDLDQDLNIQARGYRAIQVRTISVSEWGRSTKIIEDALIDSLTHPAICGVSL